MYNLSQDLEKELYEIARKDLFRKKVVLDGPQDAHVTIDGKRLVNLCSNNYLGLANNRELSKATTDAINKFGIGSGASRLICGNQKLHQKLEESLAVFKKSEACLLFSSGYMANLGIISSIAGRADIVFSDKLNHASIIDGIILSRAELKRYPHKDVNSLEDLLKKSNSFRRKIIVTDSVFSMDGDLAPLEELVEISKKYNCILMLDEAHATGVFGKRGSGLAEALGLEKEIDIHMGTLSKAVGTFGAYACGSKYLIDYLINKARSFIYTTGMPAAICAASIKALEIIEKDTELRERLWDNAKYLREGISRLGFDTLESNSPIIPLMVFDTKLVSEFSKKLFDKGMLVSAIRPPTVPAGKARLRVTVMATHKRRDLDCALEAFKKIGKELKLI